MYSQQEYDMVRRQTMQIEAEKRALLRWALIAVTFMLAVSLVLTGWMYRRWSVSEGLINSADAKAADSDKTLQQAVRELAEKNAILEQYSASRARHNAVIESTVPRMLSQTARDVEMAELAQAIYQQPGHVIELPGIPPNKIFRQQYRIRVDGSLHKFLFVPGTINGKQVIYSVLVKNQED